jgi:hypothetical protein
MSRGLDGGSNVAAVVEVARVETEAPAWPALERGGRS